MNWLLWITILAVTPSLGASDPRPYPSVACTPQELTRLRNAYQSSGSDHDVVAKRIEQADAALNADVVFPPEGGQHNQWYQCDQCQLALKTVDATHHRCPKCGTVYSGYRPEASECSC
jgi:PHP family Zn ribbon phosphoesterase